MGGMTSDPALVAALNQLVRNAGSDDMAIQVGTYGPGRVIIVVHNREGGIGSHTDWKGAAWNAAALILHGTHSLMLEGMTAEEAYKLVLGHYWNAWERQVRVLK